MPNRPLVLGSLIFILDFLSKYFVHHHVPLMRFSHYPYNGIGVFKDFMGIEFSITHAINKGAAWGLFAQFQDSLLVLRLLLIIGLFIYLAFFNRSVKNRLALTLIFAGALGNVVDYFIYGHVVDMFHFVLWGYDYPVFNIADSAIFLGICGLIFQSWKEHKPITESRSHAYRKYKN